MADPVYTQCDPTSKNWQIGTDATWTDYDLYTNMGVPKGAVAEIIMANIVANTENLAGVRTDGSSLDRFISLHEAEPDNETHVRMFVLCDASTGYIECYAGDDVDIKFYLVGYWENVSFTELQDLNTMVQTVDTWEDKDLAVGAGRVHHIIMCNTNPSGIYHIAGVRAKGSSLERKLRLHEAEAGGYMVLDVLVKADSSEVIQIYADTDTYVRFCMAGYFGSELDFVEKWQELTPSSTWTQIDISSYLDQNGRTCDFLLGHHYETAAQVLGVRDGDDTTTERKLTEHEAEASSSTPEYTGFGMSAKSNSSGKVYAIAGTPSEAGLWLTGYFKFEAAGAIVKLAAETVNLAEALLAAAWKSYRFIAEAVTLPEGFVRRAWSGRIFSSTASLTEALVRRGRAIQLVSATEEITEGLVKLLFYFIAKIANETITLGDSLLRRAFAVRFTPDIGAVTEGFVRRGFAVHLLTETISLIDGAVKWLSGGMIRIINETVAITEGASRRLRGVYLTAESVSLVDTLLRRLWTRYLSAETVIVSEVKIRRARFIKVLNETIGILGSAIQKTTGYTFDVLANLTVRLQRRFTT